MGGTKLEFVESIRFLGLIFDRKLTWKEHILALESKCKQRMNIMKYLAHTSWGADKPTLLKIYRSFIRSKLDYGSILYGSANRSLLKKLDSIHNSCIRLATGAYRTSPVVSIEVEAQEPSLQHRRYQLLAGYVTKLVSHPSNPAIEDCFEARAEIPFYDTFFSKFNFSDVIPAANLNFPPWTPPNIEIHLNSCSLSKSDTSHAELRSNFFSTLENYQDYKQIYTDGSKLENSQTGCAFITQNESRSFKLSPIASIFTAEAFAIHQALNFLQETEDKKAIICSDSLSVLSALQTVPGSNPLIIQIQNSLHHLLSLNFSIAFCWCPGHVGVAGNTEADTLAREAASSAGPFLPLTVIAEDLNKYIKKEIVKNWQQEWTVYCQHRNPPMSVFPQLSGLPRADQVKLTRLCIGHTSFTHQYICIIKKVQPPTCISCNVPLSVKHVLITCPTYQ
ncbi:uncharacterized protein, partial [Bemisia tabaci]|uniref:uncharacterized protein n=1 Tax=Bemisia tabaci TaxID=7038 RepID=UPI003B2837B1